MSEAGGNAAEPRVQTRQLRSPVPLPRWVSEQPRRLRPTSVIATTHGVESLHALPGGDWTRLRSRLGDRVVVVQVIGTAKEHAASASALAHEVAQAWSSASEVRGWLIRVGKYVRWLSRLRSFGGTGVASGEGLDRTLVDLFGAAEGQASASTGPDLATFPGRTAEVVVEARIVAAVARGDDARGIADWCRHRAAIGQRDTVSALVCRVLMQQLCGQVALAQAALCQLSAIVSAPATARQVADFFMSLGRPESATAIYARIQGCDVNSRRARFDATLRLATAAVQAGEQSTARAAARELWDLADSADERLDAAIQARDAGDFARAEELLATLVEGHPDHRGAMTELARLRIWRLAHADARPLCDALVSRDPVDSTAQRLLGVCKYLAGEPSAAAVHLQRALELDPGDDEARIWHSECLDALGQTDTAWREVGNVQLGDVLVWQLSRARIETRHDPERLTTQSTWFIVESNLRHVLGEVESREGAPSQRLKRALDRLGGNRAERATVVESDGSLRWLRDVESPRRRAERLQLEAVVRGVDAVVADFSALTSEHPSVPFFVTYGAELVLWSGDYERALEMFEGVWQSTRTRWGYVGAGAAAMLLGQYDRALALWEEGKRHYTYLDAEATYCYRGELYRRRGQLDAAEADLSLAVTHRPDRVGAWINIALLHAARGNVTAMREAVAEVDRIVPAFSAEVQAATPSAVARADLDPATCTAQMETLLGWMRGNRSSVMYSVVDPAGQLRLVAAMPDEVRRRTFQRALLLMREQLMKAVATDVLGT